MIFDRSSGKVHLPDLVISPSWTRTGFVQSTLAGASSTAVRAHNGHSSYRLPVQRLDGKWISVVVYFLAERLTMIELTLSEHEPRTGSLDESSVEEDLRIKTLHDTILLQDLGQPNRVIGWGQIAGQGYVMPEYRFAWGLVTSFHDERASESLISVEYRASWQFGQRIALRLADVTRSLLDRLRRLIPYRRNMRSESRD